nr:hypothetical protein [Streptomyces sp. CoT10]
MILTRDGHHVADAACLQGGAELGVLAVGFVAGHPGGGDPGVERGGDHLRGQTGLGRELHRLRYPSRVAAFGILGPGVFREIEPSVDQGPAPAGGQGEEYADLGVLDTSRGAGVLPLYPCRGPALLHKAGLVDNENAAVGAEMFGGVGSQVVADGIGGSCPFSWCSRSSGGRVGGVG